MLIRQLLTSQDVYDLQTFSYNIGLNMLPLESFMPN